MAKISKLLLEGILAAGIILGAPSVYSAQNNKKPEQKMQCYMIMADVLKKTDYDKAITLDLMEKLRQNKYNPSLVEYKDENDKPVYFVAIKTDKTKDELEKELRNKLNKKWIGAYKKENTDRTYIEDVKRAKEFRKNEEIIKQDKINRENVKNAFYEFINAFIQEDAEKAASYINSDGNFMDIFSDTKNKTYSDKTRLIAYLKYEFEKEDLKKLKLEEVILKDKTDIDGYEERNMAGKVGKYMKKGDYALMAFITDKWPGGGCAYRALYRKIDNKWKMIGNYMRY